MKIKLIACDVLTRELSAAIAESEHIFYPTFVPFGLHATPNLLRERLQAEINGCEGQGYDCIVLGYGLCSRGTADLVAGSVPIVIPRAHDCITLFLGSRQRYAEEFQAHPGTYYFSSGWVERADGEVEQGSIGDKKALDADARFQEYVEKYGEDNARFLFEQETQWLSNYSRAVLIDTGVGPIETYREFIDRISQSRGWACEEMKGDMSLLDRIVRADFRSEDFLTVGPGERVIESFNEGIITSKRAS